MNDFVWYKVKPAVLYWRENVDMACFLFHICEVTIVDDVVECLLLGDV